MRETRDREPSGVRAQHGGAMAAARSPVRLNWHPPAEAPGNRVALRLRAANSRARLGPVHAPRG